MSDGSSPSLLADPVLSAARQLWPDSGARVVRRLATASSQMRRREWLILPNARRARLLVPMHGRGAETMLSRQDGGARNPWMFPVAAQAMRAGVLDLLPLDRLVVPTPNAGIESALEGLLGRQVTVGVRLGRQRAHRAQVVQAFDRGGATVCFAKLGSTAAAGAALLQEAANLEWVHALAPAGIQAPQVLHCDEWNGQRLLLISALRQSGSRRRPGDGIPIAAMRRFATGWGTAMSPMSSSPFMTQMVDEARRVADASIRTALLQACARLAQTPGKDPIVFGRWHGDWTPWNMAYSGSEILLWDWEHSEPDVPVGFDALHYRAQELRHLRRDSYANGERIWLSQAPALLERCGVSPAVSSLVVAAYLLRINCRFVLESQRPPGRPEARVGWGLGLLEEATKSLTVPASVGRLGHGR